jgi:hypothetical protein
MKVRAHGTTPCNFRFGHQQQLIKKKCLDRGSNTGPLDLQSNALPTELSKRQMMTQGNLEYTAVRPGALSSSVKRAQLVNRYCTYPQRRAGG